MPLKRYERYTMHARRRRQPAHAPLVIALASAERRAPHQNQ